MAEGFVLAIDQGTSSTRAFVVDALGRVAGSATEPLSSRYPGPGRVEQDPGDIWRTVQQAVRGALANASLTTRQLTAVGIANQRETVVLWDRGTGAPVSPAIAWQDRRSAALCDELRAAGHEPAVVRASGLRLDPYFSAPKVAWALRADPHLRESALHGELALGTIDAFLIWNLTGGERHLTDFTNASRTLLFNVGRGRWDDDLCALFEIPASLLPRAQPSRSNFGTTDPEFFGAAVPITGVAGDQTAALFGQACASSSQVKATYGTGAFVLASAGSRPALSENGLLLSLGPNAGPGGAEYVLEGPVFAAGATLEWLADDLRVVNRVEELAPLAATVPDSGGVIVVPAFSGLGAPDWDPYARAAILGLDLSSTRAHVARAALEGIALSVAEVVTALSADLPQPVREIRVDGGAAANDLLMQMQADFAGVPVLRPAQIETTGLGAAYLAGLSAGLWQTVEEVCAFWRLERTFEPEMDADARGEALLRWRGAVHRASGWARPS